MGHNHPVCQIKYTYEYNSEAMCVACERVLHSRWILSEDWEHRWYHERGACLCPATFHDVDDRSIVVAAGSQSGSQSDDEATLSGSPTMCAVGTTEADKHASPGVKTKQSGGEASKQPVAESSTHHGRGRRHVVVEVKRDQEPHDRVPALYEEATDGDKTILKVRHPSQFAAEWLEDHRGLHSSGACHCGVTTEPITKSNGKGALTAEEERILALHHQITGDGFRLKETPPTRGDVDQWRKETGIPNLGSDANYTVSIRRTPETINYPVPLGNNMFLTESFVVWDAKCLSSRIESMQITTNAEGNGVDQSVRVPNGTVSTAQEKVWVYQPGGSGSSKQIRKKGQGRPSDRSWPRRETNADPFDLGSRVNRLLGWQQQGGQNTCLYDPGRPGFGGAQIQQPRAPYGFSASQQQQKGFQYGMPPSLTEYQGRNGVKPPMQAQYSMTPSHSAPHPQKGNNPQTETSNMTVTPPQQPTRIKPGVIHYIHGAENVIGWYLTPPNTHAGNGIDGEPLTPTASTEQTPTKPSRKTEEATVLPPAVVNGSRTQPNQNGSSNCTSSGTNSAAVTPVHRRKKTAARKLKIKEKKKKEKRFKEETEAAARENGNGDNGDEQPRDNTPVCGLPIGAGPEGGRCYMPPFAECSLFRPARMSTHRRGSSCPQFPDTQPLVPVSSAVEISRACEKR